MSTWLAFLFFNLCLMVGCGNGSGNAAQVESSFKGVGGMESSGEHMANDVNKNIPPAPDSVLYFIYDVDGDGRKSYPVGDERVASFFFGYEFKLSGQVYYTGFAYNTQAKYGNPPTGADPAGKLALTEATFSLNAPGAEKPWKLFGASPYLGRFGLMDKADEYDDSREILEYRVSSIRLLIAVPVKEVSSSSTFKKYLLFTFSPEQSEGAPNGWSYLGSIDAGDVNTHWCDSEKNMEKVPCLDSSGELEFVPAGEGAMPEIRVVMKGTVLDDETGDARPVKDIDNHVYTFAGFKEGEGYRFK